MRNKATTSIFSLSLLALLRAQDSHRSVDTCNDQLLSILTPINSSQNITILLTLDQQFPSLVLVNPSIRSYYRECLSRVIEFERVDLNVVFKINVGRVRKFAKIPNLDLFRSFRGGGESVTVLREGETDDL